AAPLADRAAPGTGAPSAPGLLRQTYTSGGLAYDVARVTRGSAAGAFVRVRRARGEATPPARDLRNFGPVHLDRCFETTRLALAPLQGGKTLKLTRKAETSAVAAALGVPAPCAALVEREAA